MPELRRTETSKLLCLEETGPYQDLSRLFERLTDFMNEREVAFTGDRMAIIYDPPRQMNPERLHYAAALETAGEITGDGEMIVVTQPAAWVACETHSGAYDRMPETYARLLKWMDENGYRLSGPAREYYLYGPGPGGSGDASQASTEIQLPVEKI